MSEFCFFCFSFLFIALVGFIWGLRLDKPLIFKRGVFSRGSLYFIRKLRARKGAPGGVRALNFQPTQNQDFRGSLGGACWTDSRKVWHVQNRVETVKIQGVTHFALKFWVGPYGHPHGGPLIFHGRGKKSKEAAPDLEGWRAALAQILARFCGRTYKTCFIDWLNWL